MRCPHCNTPNPDTASPRQPVDGGRAYSQTCVACGRVIGLRPRTDADPPAAPQGLTDRQVERLRFVRWRLHEECAAQTGREPGSPQTAA